MASASIASSVPWATAGWSFFIGENIILSHNRTQIIEAVGDSNYHLAYSSLSTVATAAIGYGWMAKIRNSAPAKGWAVTQARSLAGLSGGVRVRATGPRAAAAFALQASGLVLASQLAPALQVPVELGSASSEGTTVQNGADAKPLDVSVAAPAASPSTGFKARCPFDFHGSDLPPDGVGGPVRVSRHAALWSFGAIALGAAVATPLLPEACFLSMPAIVALCLGEHQDYRFRRGLGGELSPAFDARTSNVPFLALITGSQEDTYIKGWQALGNEVKGLNALVGILGAMALYRYRAAGWLLPASCLAATVV